MVSQKVKKGWLIWSIRCELCQMDLTEPGALIFSPPTGADSLFGVMVRKYHICLKCWEEKKIV